jgi:DNA-binding LacI/PurR family transcriptional regulator
MESPKLNINSIAKMAGVSTTTVSNFINRAETFPIGAEKRRRIMDAMRRVNYRPSAASGSLRRNSALPGKAVFIFGNNPESRSFATMRNPMLGELVSELDVKMAKKLGLSLEIRAIADENSFESWNESIADATP